MGSERARTLPREFLQAWTRFERWRREEKPRCRRIPEELWATAVDLAKTHGAWKTARALGLNYDNLRVRCETDGVSERRSPESPFVEITAGPAGEGLDCVVEVEDRHGTKLRIPFRGTARTEIIQLACELWRGVR